MSTQYENLLFTSYFESFDTQYAVESFWPNGVWFIDPAQIPDESGLVVYGRFRNDPGVDGTIRVYFNTEQSLITPTPILLLTVPLVADQGFFRGVLPPPISLPDFGYILLSLERTGGPSDNVGLSNPSVEFYLALPEPPPALAVTPRLDTVEVLSQDSILLKFNTQMVTTGLLSELTTYTVTPNNSGAPVTVKGVSVGHDLSTDQVVLVLSQPTLGETYTITLLDSLQTITGDLIDPNFVTKQFVDRLTKADSVFQRLPKFYTREHGSNLRTVMQAIAQADERIGGNRNDMLT